MGNLRQSMTEEEWNDLGRSSDALLINIIKTDGEEDIISKIIDEKDVNHPEHYGGKDNPYEVIKIIDAYGLGYAFSIGNVIKYTLRAGKKTPDALKDLKKAQWYIQHAIDVYGK